MHQKRFEKEGRFIPAIGIGMGLSGNLDYSEKNLMFLDCLSYAFSIGMTFVDTAEIYGNGQSEELIGTSITGIRDEIFVATKVSPQNLQHRDLLRAADFSLRRLGTDFIDLYQVHWSNRAVPLAETCNALTDLVRAGKVLRIGVCNFTLSQVKEFKRLLGDIPLSSVQNEYNLFDRSIEADLLPYCKENEISVIASSPLDQGMICGGGDPRSALDQISLKYGVTTAQLALAWIVKQENVFAIPKASGPTHIRQNAMSANINLDEEDVEKICQITSNNQVELQPDQIQVMGADTGRPQMYFSIEEAIANAYGHSPSPMDLANDLLEGNLLKPIKVKKLLNTQSEFSYELIEGRMRYWAWIIAFGIKCPILTLVRE